MTDGARPRRWLIAVAVALFLALSLSTSVAVFYTDLLWFRDLGQGGVFWTTLWSRLAAGAVFGLTAFVIVYANALIARRMAPAAFLRFDDTVMPQQVQEAIVRFKATVEPVIRWILLGAAGFIAFVAGSAMAANWEVFQFALHATSFGQADPQFGLDIGFFVFTLPALRLIADWLFGLLVVALLVAAAVHFIDGSIRPWDKLAGFDEHVKAHLSVLGGLIIATKAFDYLLRIYELDFSPRGQVIGASFTDVHAQLPAYYILIGIAIVSGALLLLNIRFRGWRLIAVALGVWLAAVILVGNVYPALVQQFRVSPNEIAAEEPYIERNIAFTRMAYDIDRVDVQPFAATEDLTSADLQENESTIQNVRLWDPGVVQQSYKQLQEIRFYYDFNDADIDRYELDGRQREVLVSVRELNSGQLSEQAKTFVNQHLVYTHGYGAVVSPVNQASGQGLPLFLVKDLPPASSAPELEIERPGIYFGEETSDYVVVDTNIDEFDYPLGDENAKTNYDGATGVEVGGLIRRLAFALRFGSSQLLLSSYIRPESKVLFDRSLTQRVGRIAPWLQLDGDPYPVIVDGRIVWVLDGYTWSDRYPYSERYNGLNYIRNSVKVTVDAYDGTVTLYAFDEEDPVLASWGKVFPELLTPASEMPEEIRAHLRYPEDLFYLQADVYKTYHMRDAQVFYNKEDQWTFPGEEKGDPMRPFYVLMRLPGREKEEFILMLPFTPRNKDNMIGWMAAKSDPANYGERVVFAFPKQRLILGPEQIGARVNQDPQISQQLSLWNQRGSQVIFGNLLVIPIKDSIVYVQPLYLQAERTAMPELTRVLVAYGDQVAMEEDLAGALASVFGDGAAPGPSQEGTGQAEPPAGGGEIAGDAARASELYDRALDAQRRGDWARYGQLIEELGDVLERLSSESTATP